MRVCVLKDFAGKHGQIVHAGASLDMDDADAYELIHAGLVEPPLRLRAAVDCLIGRYNLAPGDLVDVPPDRTFLDGRDRRVEPLAAVVRIYPGGEHGEAEAAPPAVALQIIRAGGRYATREEAAPLDLGGRDRFATPAVAYEGPTTRLFFNNVMRLADGRIVNGGEFADVPEAEAEELAAENLAERCVEVRVLHDGLVVDRHYAAGDLVTVPRSIAGDKSRFERIGVEGAVRKVVDVLGMVSGRQPEPPARPASKRATPAESL